MQENLIKQEEANELKSVLKEIVEWWDNWMESQEPENMEDPPINAAKKLLKEIENK